MFPARHLPQEGSGRIARLTGAVGVDGARGGWVAATREGPRGFARFADVLAAHPRALVMVDIPIGLVRARTGTGDRACDKEARAALRPHGSRVFPPPRRDQLRLVDEPFRAGLGLSAQTHAILPKIREVDKFREDARVREAHPELAFKLASRDGRPLPRKASGEGKAARARILRRLGLAFPRDTLGVRATRADVDDAAILCWLGEEALADRVGAYGEAPLLIWGRQKTTSNP